MVVERDANAAIPSFAVAGAKRQSHLIHERKSASS